MGSGLARTRWSVTWRKLGPRSSGLTLTATRRQMLHGSSPPDQKAASSDFNLFEVAHYTPSRAKAAANRCAKARRTTVVCPGPHVVAVACADTVARSDRCVAPWLRAQSIK